MFRKSLVVAVGLALMPVLVMAQSMNGQLLDNRLEQIDEKRDAGAFEESLEELESLRSQHPDNAEVLWRLARVKSDVGEYIEDKNEKKRLFTDAIRVAERAVELDPDNAETHISMSITAGRAGLISGTRAKVRYSRAVKDHVDRAIDLDPENDLAYHVRGLWNHEVAMLGFVARTVLRTVYGGLPDASLEQAREDFETAISIEDRVAHRLELGRTLLEMGERELALEQFDKAIQLPSKDPHDLTRKQKAHRLLQRNS